MNERVQRVLDGELDAAQLSPAEALELAAAERMIVDLLRGVAPEPLPDQSAAVMQRIDELSRTTSPANERGRSRSRAGAVLDWLWQPRQIALQWRPAYALAACAAVVLLLGVQPRLVPQPAPSPAPVATDAAPEQRGEPQVLVQFRLDAPDADNVTLAGDFTEWQPAHAMTRSEPGVWTVVVALDPGVHDYAFIVDGEQWVADPMAPTVSDGFGGRNSRLAVLTPDSNRPL